MDHTDPIYFNKKYFPNDQTYRPEFNIINPDIDSRAKLLYCKRPRKATEKPLNSSDLTYVHHKELDKHGLPYYIIPVVYLPKKITSEGKAIINDQSQFRAKSARQHVPKNMFTSKNENFFEEPRVKEVVDDYYIPKSNVKRDEHLDTFPEPSVKYRCEKATKRAKALTEEITKLKEKSKDIFNTSKQPIDVKLGNDNHEKLMERQERLLKLQHQAVHTRPKSVQTRLDEINTNDCNTQTRFLTKNQATNTSSTNQANSSKIPKICKKTPLLKMSEEKKIIVTGQEKEIPMATKRKIPVAVHPFRSRPRTAPFQSMKK